MRARAFLFGALCAATITALAMEMLSARAEHRERQRAQIVALEREAVLRDLADLSLQVHEIAELAQADRVPRKKILKRLAHLHGDIDALALDVQRAPVVSGGPQGWPDDDDDDDDDGWPDERRAAPMSDQQFQRFLAAVDGATYASDQLGLVQQQASVSWFTAAQVGAIMDQFSYSTDKIEAAVTMWPRIVDPQNGYLVYQHLAYSSDRETLRQRVGAIR
jgi:hypothetical protein